MNWNNKHNGYDTIWGMDALTEHLGIINLVRIGRDYAEDYVI